MIKITDFELSTAKEIINIGLAKAADSLSFFMKEKILIEKIDFKFKNQKEITCYSTLKRNNNFVLKTKVIGDISGICYLIFSKNDAKKVLEKSLPGSFKFSEENINEMGGAVLLEIDNIVSASVITQFSNLLKFKLYGEVPDLKKINGRDFFNFQKEDTNKINKALTFRTKFVSANKSFSPEFIWVLDKHFFEGVKRYIESSDEIKKIKNTKEKLVKIS